MNEPIERAALEELAQWVRRWCANKQWGAAVLVLAGPSESLVISLNGGDAPVDPFPVLARALEAAEEGLDPVYAGIIDVRNAYERGN